MAPLVDILLGRDPGLRRRTSMSLLAVATAVVFAGVQQGEVALGLLDQRASNLLGLGYLCGLLVFYLFIRLELTRSFSDPSLSLPQSIYGVACLAWSYGIHGPTRGAVLMIILFVIIYGMFSLTSRQVAALGTFAFAALVATMVYRAAFARQGFELGVELTHLGLFVVTIAGASGVSVRLNEMRLRMKAQKLALEEALARVSRLATRDELTGLLNRRALLELLRSEASRSARSGKALGLAIIDLDHFKRINDEHGHQAGDVVLQSFANVAQTAVRTTDVLARWGGEEFLLLLPDTPAVDALVVLERVRQSLAKHEFDGVARPLTVTFSAGVSECFSVAEINRSIELADQALYRAKNGGRDCSMVAEAVGGAATESA